MEVSLPSPLSRFAFIVVCMVEDRLLLLVEDDAAFAHAQALVRAPGLPRAAWHQRREVQQMLTQHRPQYAVMDASWPAMHPGLNCVQMLHLHNPDALIVVLTGYAIAGVEAVKLGACHYLAKPSNTDAISATAFGRVEGRTDVEVSSQTTSIKTWNGAHSRDLAESGFNISEAARAGHAPAHPGAQAGKTPGQVTGVRLKHQY